MSEIRVNSIVAAEGTSAPNLPYGVQVPTGMGITGAGGVNITGVVTATSFSGSGASLTGIAVTENVRTNTITVSGVSTFTGAVNTGSTLTVTGTEGVSANLYLIADDGDDDGDGWRINSNQDANDLTISNNTSGSYVDKLTLTNGGAVTITGGLSGTTGTFSGAVNVDATTDSTSATSGALIVDGGLGVAKNVYIGAGLSVAGTLTYEDVTNVDSVGVITAKSGVNISGGELLVGSNIKGGTAGVLTATTFVGALTGNVTGTATNATHVYIADNESTNENNNILFIEDAGTSSGNAGVEMDGNFFYNPSTGRLTATQLSGTLQTAAQTNITSVGTLAGLTVGSAGEFKVGTGVTIASTSGVSTFANDVTFVGAGAKNVSWDKSNGAFEFNDDARIKIGNSADLSLYHDGTNSYIQHGNQGNLRYQSGNHDFYNQAGDEFQCRMLQNGGVTLYYDGSERYATTGAGSSSVGVSTFQDFSSYGMLKERVEIVANKLSAGTNIDLEKGNIWYYTTNETTTATPNIRYNSSISLNNKMVIGETVTVSIISKPNNAGYYAQLTIDGSATTEEWNGGSAPSSANSGGYDVTVHQITKTSDAGWLVLSNVSNFA